MTDRLMLHEGFFARSMTTTCIVKSDRKERFRRRGVQLVTTVVLGAKKLEHNLSGANEWQIVKELG